MNLDRQDDKQVAMLSTDEEALVTSGEVYSWSWEDMLPYPLLAQVVRDAGRKLGLEASNVTEGNVGMERNIAKRLPRHRRCIPTVKSETPLGRGSSSSDFMNPQIENKCAKLKKGAQLSLKCSGYSSYASRCSIITSKSTNEISKHTVDLLEESREMNLGSLHEYLSDSSTSSDISPTQPQVDLTMHLNKEVWQIPLFSDSISVKHFFLYTLGTSVSV